MHTHLHMAAMNHATEAARVLLAHGVRRVEYWEEQRLPLFYAASNRHASVIRMLLRNGSRPNFS
jgi:ankyrin repeat protein